MLLARFTDYNLITGLWDCWLSTEWAHLHNLRKNRMRLPRAVVARIMVKQLNLEKTHFVPMLLCLYNCYPPKSILLQIVKIDFGVQKFDRDSHVCERVSVLFSLSKNLPLSCRLVFQKCVLVSYRAS